MKILIFTSVMIFSGIAAAEQYFKASEVTELMKKSPEAKAADKAANAVAQGNPEIKGSLYGIAEGIMPWLIETTGGDEVKMKKLLEEAQNNPEAFLQRLPANIRAQVAGVVQKLEPPKKPANPVP